jgi:hypothetical protein
MILTKLINLATNKDKFRNLIDYVDFCKYYLEYISEGNLQATIISQNENHYCFYQYDKKGRFQITRPINTNLMYKLSEFNNSSLEFLKLLKNSRSIKIKDIESRKILNNITYTIQQSIGSTLDALPAGNSNTARKINGDLFENFIRLIIREMGITCRAGVIQIPVFENRVKLFDMSYQHDLIIENKNDIRVIASIKTSSKDRIDKIFIDKFLYNKLTGKNTPHIAIFLNDVQRKGTKEKCKYGISSTFLPGHFKGYTIKLNPLDGVYYCDIRPNMLTEDILKDHINSFDVLLCKDIWKYI